MLLPLLNLVRPVMGLRRGRQQWLIVVHVLQVVLLVVVAVLELMVVVVLLFELLVVLLLEVVELAGQMLLPGMEAQRLLLLLERRLLHVHVHVRVRVRVLVVGLLHVCRQGRGLVQGQGWGLERLLVLLVLHERLVRPWQRCRRHGRGGRGRM
jgi:hypothetical protein